MFNEEIDLICLNVVNVQFKMVETCPMVELSRDALSFSTLPSHVIESIFSYVADEAEQNQTFTVCFSNYMSVIQSNNVSSSRYWRVCIRSITSVCCMYSILKTINIFIIEYVRFYALNQTFFLI